MAISTVGASGLNSAVSQIGKNIIINGSHEVAQRGAAVTGMGAASSYTQVDMWHIIASGTAGRVTGSQVAGPLAATGHAKAVKIDCTTADGSVASGDIMSLRTTVEAQNLQQLQWGNATAKSVTLSFWMKSPKSGTHCVSIYQEDDGRFFIKEFTIASADTYEYFAITFPGDTGGTIDTNNGPGIRIDWPLICGSGEAGAAGAWTSGGKFATSNQQNLLDSTDNNVELAGVQLELGTVATDFEHEPVSVTLAKCQRYLFRINQPASSYEAIGSGFARTATQCIISMHMDVPMRVEGTLSAGGTLADIDNRHAADDEDTTALSSYAPGTGVYLMAITIGAGNFTVGEGVVSWIKGGSNSTFIQVTSEL